MAAVEIYIGAPLEHGSDRQILARVAELLEAHGTSAILIANTHFGGRQIDLIVAVEQGAAVLEAKGYNAPVRGGENGAWQVRLASGEWKDIRNPHTQTIDARHAVRDAMRQFAGEEAPYPDAGLVFLPRLPGGSAVKTGNFKVILAEAVSLASALPTTAQGGWPLARWRAFAQAQRLMPVSSLEAALDPLLLEADELLSRYAGTFSRTYGPIAAELVSGTCRRDDEPLSFDELASRAVEEPSLALIGPSGCGKSLFSCSLALAAIARGEVSIILAAKDFDGSLSEVANREVTLLGAPSAKLLINAALRSGRPLLFVIDGYNECAPAERQRLTRGIAAAARRYEARIILSGQSPVERADLLDLHEYTVQRPERETKLAIARQAADGAKDDALRSLLDTVTSGLEARIVGELAKQLPAGTSRYGLFDLYVRERLGSDASNGIKALSRVAGVMFDRLTFGVSVRELDRLFDKEGLGASLLQVLQSGGLLERRGDRFTFSHEMFLNVFAAEAVVRQADGSADTILQRIASPRHAETKILIVAAIDDDALRLRVLAGTTDPEIIEACLRGQCGRAPQRWANGRCDAILASVAEEIEVLSFEVDPTGFMGVTVNSATLREWPEEDRAVLLAIPGELAAGRRLDGVLELVGAMDVRLASEHRRLRAHLSDNKVALRSGLFACCYVGVAWKPMGLAQIFAPARNGSLSTGADEALEFNLKPRLAAEGLSHGQLYLLLQLHRRARHDGPPIADILPGILERSWPFAPYHLRLDLMECCGFAGWNATDEDRRALIHAVESLPRAENLFLSTAIVDALKFLGALNEQESEHLETVRANIAEALQDELDPDRCALACAIWTGQFDHPFEGAYCEAWRELSAGDRKKLLRMAARGVEDISIGLFLVPLMVGIASEGDPAAGPLIERFAALPATRSVMLQDAIQNFAMAHIALGYLGCPLPERPAELPSAAAAALIACGDILYWLNRVDMTMAERRENCAAPLRVLSNHPAGVAAAVLDEFGLPDFMFSESLKQLPGTGTTSASIAAAFPGVTADILRAALKDPDRQRGYFDFFNLDHLMRGCLSGLGHWGTVDDIDLIRPWSGHPKLGRYAIATIKRLENAPTPSAREEHVDANDTNGPHV